MQKFIDLKIAITIKIIIVSLLVFYVRQNRTNIAIDQIDQHLTR